MSARTRSKTYTLHKLLNATNQPIRQRTSSANPRYTSPGHPPTPTPTHSRRTIAITSLKFIVRSLCRLNTPTTPRRNGPDDCPARYMPQPDIPTWDVRKPPVMHRIGARRAAPRKLVVRDLSTAYQAQQVAAARRVTGICVAGCEGWVRGDV
jgi:hypothetical protein